MPAALEALVSSGRIADLILALLALELLALAVYRWRGGLRLRMRDVVPNTLSGASLVLALRVALTDGPVWALAAWLLAAFAAHLTDLALRARGR
ncbi:MAG: hypothetical protein AAFR04_15400 [Pseudomonadota bacterium]